MTKTMERNLNNNFELIKNNVIYMDWNVISYLCNPKSINNKKLKSEVICLTYILFEYLDINYLAIPYSNAHLLDVMNGAQEFEEQSLKMLDFISNGVEIAEYQKNKESLIIYKVENILDNFSSYKEHLKDIKKESKNISTLLSPIFEFVKNYIEYTSEISSPDENVKDEIKDLTSCLFSFENEELTTKLFRKNKKYKFESKKIFGKKIKFPLYDSVKAKYPDKDIKELVDLCFKLSDFPISSYDEFIKNFSIPATPALSSFNNRINDLHSLAEFINVSSEKLDSKSPFQGIVNDQFHLAYGLRCTFFITEDDALYKKAVFIKEFINSGTGVFKIDEFNKYLLKNISKQLSTKSNNEKKVFSFKFNDSEGNLIKEYIIEIE